MPENLASFKVFCQGGLNTSRDVLSQGENQPGSADIKNKTQLDMMITCLRNIYYKGNS